MAGLRLALTGARSCRVPAFSCPIKLGSPLFAYRRSLLTGPAAAQPYRGELVFMPLSGHFLSARLGNVSSSRLLTYGTPDRVLVDNLKPATRSFRYR